MPIMCKFEEELVNIKIEQAPRALNFDFDLLVCEATCRRRGSDTANRLNLSATVGPGALGRPSPAWWITSRPFITHISVIGDIKERVTL